MTTRSAIPQSRNRNQLPRPPVATRRARRGTRRPSLGEGWQRMPWVMRILRAFLGITFLFAGAQKLFDPNFLHAGSPTFIGTTLQAANGTPAGPLLGLLGHAPVLAGILVALVEIAIGLGTLLGVAPLTATAGGFVVNLTLLLSITWHVHPYFLGSDSIYAAAWLALFAGMWEAERARTGHVRGPIEVLDEMDRREFLRGTLVAGLTFAVAIASKALAGPVIQTLAAGRGAPTKTTGTGASGSGASTGSSAGSGGGGSTGSSIPGRTITTLDRLPVGQAIGFTAPGVGPAVLVRLANDTVVAYSRICTHAGCLVGYDSGNRILICPCHGAEFDPARGAAPIAGPAPTALQRIDVVIDPRSRKVVLPA